MEKLSLFGIFLEGLLSFLSPCVLPLLPLYMAYLSNGAREEDEEGNVRYKTGKVFVTTLFFVFGICTTFVLLGLGVSFISKFIEDYADIIAIIGGTLMIVFGLHETGLITINVLNEERRIKVNLHMEKMNFLKAYLFGLLFSFAWSPCIGPLLANALLLSATETKGLLYLLFYALGLIIPFLITGLFTGSVLNFFNKRKKILKYVTVVAGIILILFGSYMIYNASRNIVQAKKIVENAKKPYLEKEFYDQNGNRIVLGECEGDYVFLNFITTWCPYCKQFMPEYLSFAKNSDAKCFYVMSPYAYNEKSEDDIKAFIKEYNIDIPVIIDTDGTLIYEFNVSSFPVAYVLSPKLDVLGYAVTSMNEEGLNEVYSAAKEMNVSK